MSLLFPLSPFFARKSIVGEPFSAPVNILWESAARCPSALIALWEEVVHCTDTRAQGTAPRDAILGAGSCFLWTMSKEDEEWLQAELQNGMNTTNISV